MIRIVVKSGIRRPDIRRNPIYNVEKLTGQRFFSNALIDFFKDLPRSTILFESEVSTHYLTALQVIDK